MMDELPPNDRLADDVATAVRHGESARAYIARQGWIYHTVRSRLIAAGLWDRVMRARYEEVDDGQQPE